MRDLFFGDAKATPHRGAFLAGGTGSFDGIPIGIKGIKDGISAFGHGFFNRRAHNLSIRQRTAGGNGKSYMLVDENLGFEIQNLAERLQKQIAKEGLKQAVLTVTPEGFTLRTSGDAVGICPHSSPEVKP